jgi:tetratricopeptide (TPR) repeat protein
MDTMSTPSTLHLAAAKLREQGESLRALSTYEEALYSYLKNSETEYLLAVLLEKNIVLKHLWKQSHLPEYLDIARTNLVLGEKWLKKFNFSSEKLALFYFGKAELHLLDEDVSAAITTYSQALQTLPDTHLFAGQFRYHLGFAQVLNQQIEEGLRNLQEGRAAIEQQTGLDAHTKQVWLSGAWLRLSLAQLQIGALAQAQEAYSQAESIIANDPNLVLRQRDLKQVATCLQKGSFFLQEVL